MTFKGSISGWFLVLVTLFAALGVQTFRLYSKPTLLCGYVATIEPDASCSMTDENEAKVELADKSELYCYLVAKKGLDCKPIKQSPQTSTNAQPAPPPAPAPSSGSASGSAAGSGSSAPPPKPAGK